MSTSFVSVNSTVSPTRQCTIGPGMSPSNVHAATTVSSVMRTGASRACQLSCSVRRRRAAAARDQAMVRRALRTLRGASRSPTCRRACPLRTAESRRLSELCGCARPAARRHRRGRPASPRRASCRCRWSCPGEQARERRTDTGIASVSAEARVRKPRRSCSSDSGSIIGSSIGGGGRWVSDALRRRSIGTRAPGRYRRATRASRYARLAVPSMMYSFVE